MSELTSQSRIRHHALPANDHLTSSYLLHAPLAELSNLTEPEIRLLNQKVIVHEWSMDPEFTNKPALGDSER